MLHFLSPEGECANAGRVLTTRRLRSALLPVLLIAASLAASQAPARTSLPVDAAVSAARERAVAQARAGDYEGAISALEALYSGDPEAVAIRQDLAVVSAWAGDDQRAVELLTGRPIAEMPEYVLSAYAKSARNLSRWDLSASLYDALVSRHPEAVDPHLGRALALADAGRFADADTALKTAERLAGSDPTALARAAETCGYVAERQRRFTQALACYERALRLQPGLREARRRKILVASALGASVKALEEARRHPSLLTADEQLRLELDAAAMHIRWADLPNPEAPLQDAARALSSQDEIADRLDADPDAPAARALALDRVAALASAYRMAEAIALFESLRAPSAELTDFPAYVLASAGQAYLYQEQPETAADCFRAALAQEPERFDLKIGLFYAYSDSHDYAAARTLAAELLAGESAWKRPAAGVWIANGNYPDVRGIGVMELAFRERYEPALRDLDGMLAIAPANSSLRLARAQLMQWRGWNEQADQEAARVRVEEPDSLPAVVLSGITALETQRYAAAEHATREALQQAPYSKAALGLGERWLIHNRPEIEVRAEADRSDGSTFGSEGWRTDAWYFSKPMAYHYRWFLHDQTSYAEFEEGKGRDHRLGGGMEYRNHRLTARGEVHRGIEQNDDTGATASASWRQSDYLSWNMLLAANTPNMPLRGTRAGVTADEAQVGARYRWHESRDASVNAGVMEMDDDNQRRWVNLGFRQRVLNAPRHKLDLDLSAYASDNDETGRIYYNPQSDRELAGEVTHEWRIRRRYDHAMTQRISARAGSYWQENYGSASIWRLALEHEWELGPRALLGYGVSWAGRVYDGEREHEKSAFVTFRGYP